MRKVTIGKKTIELRATPLALLFYRQAFNRDLIADTTNLTVMMENLKAGDFKNFDSLTMLQLAYAMHMAAQGKITQSFPEWLNGLKNVDYSDYEWVLGVVEEAVDGFFRSAGSTGAAPTKPESKRKPATKQPAGPANTSQRKKDGA